MDNATVQWEPKAEFYSPRSGNQVQIRVTKRQFLKRIKTSQAENNVSEWGTQIFICEAVSI